MHSDHTASLRRYRGPNSEQTPYINNYLSIMHLNIHSIRNKINYITDHFANFDIICFTESHLDAKVPDTDLLIDTHERSLYRRDHSCHSGGIVIFVSDKLFSKRRYDLESECFQSIWVSFLFYISTASYTGSPLGNI